MARGANSGGSDGEHPLKGLLDDAIDSAEDGRVSIGTLLDAFGSRGFGPIISIFALIAATPPIGGIPGVPTTMGLLTLLVAVQLLFGSQHPWVPQFIQKRGVKKEKLEKARKKASSVLGKIDALVGPRLKFATTGPAEWLAALCCVLLGLTMPPLELLPFAAALPAAAILMFGLGLTARDGLLMLIGFAATGGTAYVIATNLPKLIG